jgi:hypothetical protein
VMVDFGVAKVFERKVFEAIAGVFWQDFAGLYGLHELAEGFAVHRDIS